MKKSEKELEVDNQRPDEIVVLQMRRHPWVLFNPFLVLYAVLIGTWILILIFGWPIFIIYFSIIAVAFIISYGSIAWFSYTHDLFVLTNQRIIKIDQKGLFSRKVSETELDNAINVNYEIHGMRKTLMNYGDVNVSTVGDEVSMIAIHDISNPHFVQERIIDLHKKYKAHLNSQ